MSQEQPEGDKLKFILSYIAPLIEACATFGLAITTVFVGTWASGLNLTPNNELGELITAFKAHYIDWTSPVPYFCATLIVSLLGRIEGFQNRYQRGQLETMTSKVDKLNQQLRTESQHHSQSKSNYMETLERALKYRLTSSETGFNERCRVTIYKKQDGSEGTLRQIFRHSPHLGYQQNGRISVPINEGVVGAAWNNHGEMEVEISHDPNTETFRSKMHVALKDHNCSVPTNTLSMPSRHFFAMKFEDHDRGNRIGIVVFECTETGTLQSEAIRKALSDDMLNLSRMIKHLGVLRSEFQPGPREE